MFTLIKLISPFLLPPTQIFVGIILILLLVSYRKFKWAKIILVGLLIFYYGLSTAPMSDMIARSLESKVSQDVQSMDGMIDDVEAIVILSGGAHKAGGLRPHDELTKESLKRIYHGVKVYRELRSHIPIIFTGGSGNPFKQRKGIGKVAESFLLTAGVLKEDIRIEDSSRDTYESGVEVKRILDNRFPEMTNHKVFLVTSAIHLPRATKVFQRLGLNPIPAPSSYDSGPLDYNPLSFLPSIGSFTTSTAAIHEWIGIVGYRLRGRI